MNELKVFNNNEFGDVRVSIVDDEPWFCLLDVCGILGIDNSRNVKNRLSEKGVHTIDTLTKGGKQALLYINESNLYKTIFQSKKEEAEKFTEWVTSEVIPSIRKHGAYMTDNTLEEALTSPDFLIRLATELKNEKEARKKAEDKIAEDKPKVLFAEAVNASSTSILIGDLAKILKQNGYDTGQKRLFEILRNKGFLMKTGSSKNMPTQKAMEMGLFEVKETTINNPDGSIRITKTTKVTGAGQQFFINMFLAKAS
jgi:prophage antirepressor